MYTISNFCISRTAPASIYENLKRVDFCIFLEASQQSNPELSPSRLGSAKKKRKQSDFVRFSSVASPTTWAVPKRSHEKQKCSPRFSAMKLWLKFNLLFGVCGPSYSHLCGGYSLGPLFSAGAGCTARDSSRKQARTAYRTMSAPPPPRQGFIVLW